MAIRARLATVRGYYLNHGQRQDDYGPDGKIFRSEYVLPNESRFATNPPRWLDDLGDWIKSEQTKISHKMASRGQHARR